MAKEALFVRLEAKTGKEKVVASFLMHTLPGVMAQTGATTWFAVRFDPGVFGIVLTVPDAVSEQTQFSRKVEAALMSHADHLLTSAPAIEWTDILADHASRELVQINSRC